MAFYGAVITCDDVTGVPKPGDEPSESRKNQSQPREQNNSMSVMPQLHNNKPEYPKRTTCNRGARNVNRSWATLSERGKQQEATSQVTIFAHD